MEMTWDLADVEQLGMQVTGEFGHQHDVVGVTSFHFKLRCIQTFQTCQPGKIEHFAMAVSRIEVAIDSSSQTISHIYVGGERIAHFITALTTQMMGINSQVLGFLTDLRALGNGLSEQSYGIQR